MSTSCKYRIIVAAVSVLSSLLILPVKLFGPTRVTRTNGIWWQQCARLSERYGILTDEQGMAHNLLVLCSLPEPPVVK